MSLNPFWLFLISGVALVAVELLVFQFTTFWLFFIGLGALVAAAYAWLSGDVTYTAATGVFLVASVVVTAILYAPIRRWQNKPAVMEDNTAIGKQVTVKDAISANQAGSVNWSGSDWQAELAAGESGSIESGQTAIVVDVQGIRLLVKPVAQ